MMMDVVDVPVTGMDPKTEFFAWYTILEFEAGRLIILENETEGYVSPLRAGDIVVGLNGEDIPPQRPGATLAATLEMEICYSLVKKPTTKLRVLRPHNPLQLLSSIMINHHQNPTVPLALPTLDLSSIIINHHYQIPTVPRALPPPQQPQQQLQQLQSWNSQQVQPRITIYFTRQHFSDYSAGAASAVAAPVIGGDAAAANGEASQQM